MGESALQTNLLALAAAVEAARAGADAARCTRALPGDAVKLVAGFSLQRGVSGTGLPGWKATPPLAPTGSRSARDHAC